MHHLPDFDQPADCDPAPEPLAWRNLDDEPLDTVKCPHCGSSVERLESDGGCINCHNRRGELMGLYHTKDNDYEADRARDYVEKLIEKGAIIEIKQKRDTRSNRQNSWLHAVIKDFSEWTGYELHEAKTYLKLIGGLGYEKNGVQYVRETRSLTTAEFAAMMEAIIRWGDQNGFTVEDPERF